MVIFSKVFLWSLVGPSGNVFVLVAILEKRLLFVGSLAE